jgi:hypothetical protein
MIMGALRASQAEMAVRTKQFALRLVHGERPAEAIEWAASEWGISRRQSEKYATRAHEQIAEGINLAGEVGRALQTYYCCQRQLEIREEWMAATLVQDKICRLLGLYRPGLIDEIQARARARRE